MQGSVFSFASAASWKDPHHGDTESPLRGLGFLAVRLRQKLGLGSGDRLEADLVDGAVVLRPAAKGRHPARREEGEEEAADPAAAGASGALPPTARCAGKRSPGGRARPSTRASTPHARTAEGALQAAQATALARRSPSSARGQRRDRETAEEGRPAAKAAPPEPAPPPADAPRRMGRRGLAFRGGRPFRHVEVRKLAGAGAHKLAGVLSPPAGPVER